MPSPEYGVSLGLPLSTRRDWAAHQGEPSNCAPYVNLGPLRSRCQDNKKGRGVVERNTYKGQREEGVPRESPGRACGPHTDVMSGGRQGRWETAQEQPQRAVQL